MKLIVGLGNPGRKYQGTRHNIGFVVAAEIARRHGDGRPKSEFQGETFPARIADQRVLLLCPHTFMNVSGTSVRAAADFYRIDPADVLVVCDDMDLPVGKLRLRAQGSAGGQKGLADIIRHLGTDAVPRLRIGVGRPPDNWDPSDYVLSKFTKEENEEIELQVQKAADAAADWVEHAIQFAMNKYNP
jgi:PTH1 family peptidyl-tRNA hydrolase